NYAEELKPERLSVRFFVRMDDVSNRILGQVSDKMSEAEREAAINREIAKIEQENNEGGKYTVSVKSFFNGNEFYYFVYEDYTDVRLVGTPPANIGKFGGDTDNWEWPRHTGDFSLFRVYTDAEGNPAKYAQDNIPMQPKHHLPISVAGIQEGDFAMILGYPGRTNRWMPAGGIEQNVKFAYPAWVEGSKVAMDAMKTHMDEDQKVKLDYASAYARIANYWKNRQGMIDALTLHKTAETKAKSEKQFDKWANKKQNRKQYGNVMTDINEYYAKTNENAKHNNYLISMLRSSSYVLVPNRLGAQLLNYMNSNEPKRMELQPALDSAINDVYANLYQPLERDVLIAQLNLYAKNGGASIAPYVAELAERNGGDFTEYVDEILKNSVFTSQESIERFLERSEE